MNVASDPVDVHDLQFKLQCKLKVFDRNEEVQKFPSNLIATASRFGLVFIGSNTNQMKVIRFESIEEFSSPNELITNYMRRDIPLHDTPVYITVNCDHTILAVVLEIDGCPSVVFYNVQSFLKQNIVTLAEARLSASSGTKIVEANWHPTIPNIFTGCNSDGTLGIYEIKGNSVAISSLPSQSQSSCFCWSPKGKQIAVGSSEGKIWHYKPDLKVVKVIEAPPFEKPHSIISLQWISNYQFIGVYKPSNDNEDQCNVVVIDAPKTGNPSFTNFYDVCYSNGNFRAPQFYTIFEQNWNILIVASANSIEVGVLASNGEAWTQWTLQDSARAELPLDENREETYPIGISLDTSSMQPVPWGETSLQPAPSLLLLSNKGILCCFKVINLKTGSVGITSPPEKIQDLSGIPAFTTENQEKGKTVQQMPTSSSSIVLQPKVAPTQTEPVPKYPATISSFAGQISLTPVSKAPSSSAATSLIGSLLLSKNEQHTSFTSVAPKPVQKPLIAQATSAPPTLMFSSQIPPTSSNVIVQSNNIEAPARKLETALPTDIDRAIESAEIENSEEIEQLYAQMMQIELSALESELKVTLFHGNQLKINLNLNEIDGIVEGIKQIEDFVRELTEICESQASEVHILKQNTVQSWAWLWEAKSRLNEYQNAEYKALLKSKPLDSVSEKHLHTLKQMEYYLDSQMRQAHEALDEQWDLFQEYCRKTNRFQVPTMEAIFQAMVKQNAVLQKQEYIMKDISSQIKGKLKESENTLLFKSLNKSNLEDSFQNLKLDEDDIYRIYHQKVTQRIKSLTFNRADQLRNMLKNREVPHVRVASASTTSVLQFTPEKKDRLVSVHLTPTTVKPTAKVLNFYQSTPMNSNFPKQNILKISEPSVADQSSVSSFRKDVQSVPNFVSTASKLQENQPSGLSFVRPALSSTTSNLMNAPGRLENIHVNDRTSASPSFGEASKNSAGSLFQAPSSFFSGVSTQTTKQAIPTTSSFGEITKAPIFSTSAFSKPSSAAFQTKENVSPSTPMLTSTIAATSESTPAATTSTGSLTAALPTQTASVNATSFNTSQTTKTSNSFSFAIATTSTDSSTFDISSSDTSAFKAPPSSGFKTVSLASVTSTSTGSIFSSQSIATSGPIFGNVGSGSIFGNATTTKTGSVFGSTSSDSKSIFGSVPKATPTSGQSVFASSPFKASLVTTSESSADLSSDVSTSGTSSLFGKSVVTTSGTSSTFGGVVVSTTETAKPFTTSVVSTSIGAVTSSNSTSIFGGTGVSTTTSSPFSSTSTPFSGAAVVPESASSPFIGTAASVNSTSLPFSGAGVISSSSLFGGSALSSTSTSLPFSGAAVTPANSTSPFGGAVVSSTSKSSPFNGSSITPVISSSPFGVSVVPSTSSSLPFGSANVNPANSPPFSGAVVTSSSPFGSVPASSASSSLPFAVSSSFGNTPASTTSSTIFGTGTSSSVFGGAAASPFSSVATSAQLFGGSASFGSITTSVTSPFGSSSVSSSPFGAVATSSVSTPFGASQPTASPFGVVATSSSPFSGVATSSASIFGTAITTTNSPFGKPSVFGQTSIFGSAFGASPVTTSDSVFGQVASNSSPFGNANTPNVFGGTTSSSAFSASPFGQSPSSSSGGLFGQSQNVFGSTSGSIDSAQPSSFGFSGLNVGTSTNQFGKTNETKSPFGGTNFNTTASSGSIFGTSAFGNTTNSTFGQTAFGSSSFGSPAQQPGPFSGGAGSVAQSGFGATSAFQKTSGFGGQPAFGGAPAFGTSPTFGGTPTFGSTSVFGGTNKVFGSSSPTGSFGSGTQQPTAFSNLSNQNTIGFGNLAQQSPNNNGQADAFGGSSSFTSWR